jgi:hypothetical protein
VQSSAAEAAEVWKDLHREYAPQPADASAGGALLQSPVRVRDNGSIESAPPAAAGAAARGTTVAGRMISIGATAAAGGAEVEPGGSGAARQSPVRVRDTGSIVDRRVTGLPSAVGGFERTPKPYSAAVIGKARLRDELQALPDVAKFVRKRPL